MVLCKKTHIYVAWEKDVEHKYFAINKKQSEICKHGLINRQHLRKSVCIKMDFNMNFFNIGSKSRTQSEQSYQYTYD